MAYKSNSTFDRYRSRQSTPLVDADSCLQGAAEAPSFNEREARRHALIEECCGHEACQQEYLNNHYAPGGSTFCEAELKARRARGY